MATRSKAFGPTAAVADTKTTIGSAYKTPVSGTIRRIRVSFYQGVIDKASNAILTLESDHQKGPFEFSVGGCMGITTTSGATGPNIPTEEIEVSIPTEAQEEWTVSMTSAEALEEVTVSLMWE